MIFLPVVDDNAQIDFYAGNVEAMCILKPIYMQLPVNRRGTFYASSLCKDKEIKFANIRNREILEGTNPIVVTCYKDLNVVFTLGEERAFILYEDTYTGEHRGLINVVSLFLCADEKSFQYRKLINTETHLTQSAETAAQKILQFVKGKEVKHIELINNKTVGIIYMAFGEKAKAAVAKSFATLKRLGFSYPVAVIGDYAAESHGERYTYLPWKLQSPFDIKQRRNFQFRAGRVKPFLCDLTPFDYTLYIDADTKFLQPIQSAFEALNEFDVIATEERLTLQQLYNKKLAGWELNLIERDTTIEELGAGAEDLNFINSGVLFFRKNKATQKLFFDWYNEWLRFQEWDEQLALMRALHANKNIKLQKLPAEWNDPHMHTNSVIFHNYGRGDVRINHDQL